MKKPALVLAALFAASILRSEDLHEKAVRLHKSAIIVDTHEDLPEARDVDVGRRVRQR